MVSVPWCSEGSKEQRLRTRGLEGKRNGTLEEERGKFGRANFAEARKLEG